MEYLAHRIDCDSVDCLFQNLPDKERGKKSLTLPNPLYKKLQPEENLSRVVLDIDVKNNATEKKSAVISSLW